MRCAAVNAPKDASMSICIEEGCSAQREDKQTRCRPHRLAYLRERYHTDPEYRARLLSRQRAQGTTSMRRRHLPDKLEEQEGRCTICGGDIPQGKGQNHIDHNIPRSRGGSDDASNVQAVCAPCNRRKGTKSMDELRSQIELPFQEPG